MKHVASMSIVVASLAGLGMSARAAEMTGREVFDHYCAQCHGSSDGPGTMQLRRTRGPQRALLTERTDLTPKYIEYVVRHGLRSMPPFAPSDLPAAKLEALAAFLAK